MTTTPASEPNRPGGPAPTTPGTPTREPLTSAQKTIAALVGTGTAFIAALGFAGSYNAVTAKAHALGFGWFANWITIGVDAGIGIFLALDLLLTWLRMPYPLLRHIAWMLTGATIVFNASASWPNPLGVGMHAVIPVLFIAATEAARHAIGRIADITADKHLEGPPPSRWFLNPVGTFVLWRRQRLWAIRTWGEVLTLERERRVYIGKLRREYGRAWRRKATADKLLVLRLATKDGLSITEAVELPAREEEKRRQEVDRIAREKQEAEDARRREADAYKLEQQRLADERARQAEADRLQREREALELEQARKADQRAQELADAEHRAALEEIARQQAEAAAEAEQRRQAAEAETERRRQQEQLAHARAVAAEQERAAEAARRRRENEEAAARAAAEKEAASRRAAEIVQRASANATSASRTTSPASASRPATSQPANPVASAAATSPVGSASAASANPASSAATSSPATNANASQGAASTVDIDEVVDVYTLLKERNGKAPSDRELGEALNVSRSRAQQLRTAAIDAGHTELAKPMRIAS